MDNSMSEGENLLGIAMQTPKFPEFSVVSKRLESFKNWPKYHPVSADILSEAGLVYTGPGDQCICYHCGFGLRQWEAGDNPWSAHAKWYPKCGHVKLVKGQRFIDAVLKGETPEHGGGSFETDEAPHEEDHLNSPAALSCLQMGYTKEYVVKAISGFIKTKGHTNFKGQDLGEIIFALRDSEDVDRVIVADGGTHEPEKSGLCTAFAPLDPVTETVSQILGKDNPSNIGITALDSTMLQTSSASCQQLVVEYTATPSLTTPSIEDREDRLNTKIELEIDCLRLKKELLQLKLRNEKRRVKI